MSEAVVDDIVAVLPPLLQSLEALGFVARHLDPSDFGRVMQATGTPDQALQAVGAAADGRTNSPTSGPSCRRRASRTCRVRGCARSSTAMAI